MEQKAAKQHRVAKSKEAIKLLGPKIKDDLADHLFDAKPFSKALEPNKPQGLHAYKSNEELPDFVANEEIEGSKGQVHTLTWRHKDGKNFKSSTMFPKRMPPDHVKTLVVLAYSQDTGNVVKEKSDLAQLGISRDDVKTYISHGQDIVIGKSGETVYPLK